MKLLNYFQNVTILELHCIGSTLDDPVGMLHIKDFVGALSKMNIQDIKIEKL